MQGIIIAGTHSGCGKTTVTLGILAALRKKGLAVQPFKAGPDFIDAGLHRLVADRPSRNLDQWMCGPDFVRDCFMRHAADADIAVVEGVMGMFDGEFNTASLACLLSVPIILVVDASGMAESAGAVVRGFAEFGVRSAESGVKFAGVIFNRVASENHYKRLKASVRDVPVLGYLPRDLDFEIPHRHLGLAVAEESPLTAENIERLADAVMRHMDVDMLCKLGDQSRSTQEKKQRPGKNKSAIRIAVAYDKAFCFYYEDNLDLLRDAGASIIKFSPLADPGVPDDLDAVYIGGGYPELHAAALSQNKSMLRSVRDWARAGKPLYAECGGLMYLSSGIRDFDEKFFTMADVFPFTTRMTRKPILGYREILLNEDCILGDKGQKCRGHEFHYSEIEDRNQKTEDRGQTRIYRVNDKAGEYVQDEGFRFKNTLASYVHIHFGGSRRIADNFAAFVKGERTA